MDFCVGRLRTFSCPSASLFSLLFLSSLLSSVTSTDLLVVLSRLALVAFFPRICLPLFSGSPSSLLVEVGRRADSFVSSYPFASSICKRGSHITFLTGLLRLSLATPSPLVRRGDRHYFLSAACAVVSFYGRPLFVFSVFFFSLALFSSSPRNPIQVSF